MANGPVYTCSSIKYGQIQDGTTNTYLFGEKYQMSETYKTDTSYSDDNGIWTGSDCDNCRVTYTGLIPLQERGGYEPRSQRFGSVHTGSLGMAMCDGSVQRISYSIDQDIHYRLGVRNDNQPVSGAFD